MASEPLTTATAQPTSVADDPIRRLGLVDGLVHRMLSERAPRTAGGITEPREDRSVLGGIGAGFGRAGVMTASSTARIPALATRAIQGLLAHGAETSVRLGVTPIDAPQPDPRFDEWQDAMLEYGAASQIAELQGRAFPSTDDDLTLRERLREATLALPPDAHARVRDPAMIREIEAQAAARGITEATEPVVGGISDTFNRIADEIDNLRNSDLLYKSPSLDTGESVFEQMGQRRWWYEQVPEYVGSAASILLPASAAGIVARFAGASSRTAVAVAARTGGLVGTAMEGGSAFAEFTEDLVSLGYARPEAERIAAGPALMHGIAAGWAETRLIPFQLRRRPRLRGYITSVAVTAGTESVEEVSQDLMRQGGRLAAGLNPTITLESMAEAAIGGLLGGGGMTAITHIGDAFAEERITAKQSMERMSPIERADAIRKTRERIEALRAEDSPNETAIAMNEAVAEMLVAVQRASRVPMPSDPNQTVNDFAEVASRVADEQFESDRGEGVVQRFRDTLPPLLEEHPDIVRSDMVDRRDLQEAVEIGRRLGLDVVVTTPVRLADGRKITGWADPVNRRAIVLTEDVQGGDAVAGVVLHEFTHQIETSGPLYDTFVGWVVSNDADGLRGAQRNYYTALNIGAESGLSFDEWAATPQGKSEGIARYVELRAREGGIYQRLRETDRPLLRRIRELWRQLRARLGGRRDHPSVERITRLIDDAIRGDSAPRLADDPVEATYASVRERFAAEPATRKLTTLEDMLERLPPERRVFEGEGAVPADGEPSIPLPVPLTKKLLQRILDRNIERVGRERVESSLEIVTGKKKGLALRMPTVDFIRRALSLPAKYRMWYEQYVQFSEERFILSPATSGTFNATVSATSQRTKVRDNMLRTISIMAEHLAGVPIRTDVVSQETVGAALTGHIFDAENSDALKTGSFNQTFEYLLGRTDTPPLPVIDALMMAVFGLDASGISQGPLYDLLAGVVIDLTAEINARMPAGAAPLQPWQLQALLWTQQQSDPEGTTYPEVMQWALEQMLEHGIAVDQNGVLSIDEATLANPRIAELLRPTLQQFKESRVATVGLATHLTATGRRAREMRDALASSPLASARKAAGSAAGNRAKGDPGGFETIIIRAITALAATRKGYRKPGGGLKRASILTELAAAIAGLRPHYTAAKSDLTAIRLSRVDVPVGAGEDVAGPAGVYESQTDINMRVPLPVDRMDGAARRIWLAVLGRVFKKEAMSAFRFVDVGEPTDPDSESHQTWSVFVPTLKGRRSHVEAIHRTLAQKADIEDASIMSEVTPNGIIFHVTPMGMGTKSVRAIDGDAFHAAVAEVVAAELDSGAEVVLSPSLMQSDYVHSSEYDQVIGDLTKELEDAESSEEWLSKRPKTQQEAIRSIAPDRRARRRLLRQGGRYIDRAEASEGVKAAARRALDGSRLAHLLRAEAAAAAVAARLEEDWRAYLRFNGSRFEQFSGEAADSGGAGGVRSERRRSGGAAQAGESPVRRWQRLYHFSRDDRSATGLNREFAGSNVVSFAGQRSERQRLGGDRDVATQPIFFYMPGAGAEAVVVSNTNVLHAIEAEVAILPLGGQEHEAILGILTADGNERTRDEFIDDFIRLMTRMGYDGMAELRPDRPGHGIVQLFRDIGADEIVSAERLTPERRRDLMRGAPLPPSVPETEFVDKPAVRVGGRVFTGEWHLQAFENAFREIVGQDPFVNELAFDAWVAEVAAPDRADDQGFLTNTGRYLTRDEASAMAQEVGQVEGDEADLANGGLESQRFEGKRRFTGEAAQTETAAFKKWFGKSKVVDERGAPLVVYHGTPEAGFTVFANPGRNDHGFFGHGFYFTSTQRVANFYANSVTRRTASAVYPVYLRMRNPLDLSTITGEQVAKIVGDEAVTEAHLETAEAIRNPPVNIDLGFDKSQSQQFAALGHGDQVASRVQAAGYDGIIAKRGGEFVVYQPGQVKSAIGNVGTFDPTNPDIRFTGELANPSTEQIETMVLLSGVQSFEGWWEPESDRLVLNSTKEPPEDAWPVTLDRRDAISMLVHIERRGPGESPHGIRAVIARSEALSALALDPSGLTVRRGRNISGVMLLAGRVGRDAIIGRVGAFTGEAAPREGSVVEIAAIRVGGKVYEGKTHYHAWAEAYREATGKDWEADDYGPFDQFVRERLDDPGTEEGFLDNEDNFLTRNEAAQVAVASGQIEGPHSGSIRQMYLGSMEFDRDRAFSGEPADAVTIRVTDAEGTVIKEETYPDWERAKPWANAENQVEGQEVEVEFPHGGGRMVLRPGKQYTGESPDEDPALTRKRDAMATWGAAQIANDERMRYDEWASRMLNRFGDIDRASLRQLWFKSQELGQSMRDEQRSLRSAGRRRKDESREVATTESKLLGLRFQQQARGARIAEQDTRRHERAAARAKVAELKRRFDQLALRLGMQQREAGRQRGRREMAAEEKERLDAIRSELMAAMKNLPSGVRIPLRAADVRTPAQLAGVLAKLEENLAAFEHRQAIGRVKRQLRTLKKTRFRPEFEEAARSILRQVDPAKLTEKTRLELETLRDAVATSDLPTPPDIAARVARLDKVPLSEMSTDDLRALEATIGQLVASNTHANQFVNDLRRASLAETVESVHGEIEPQLVEAKVDPRTGAPKRGAMTGLLLPLLAEVNGKPDAMAEMISGGENTLTHGILYEAVQRAQRRWMRGHQEAMDFLEATLQDAGFTLGSDSLARTSYALAADYGRLRAALDLSLRQAISGPVHAEAIPVELASGRTIMMSRAERMSLLAHFMDPSTLGSMLDGAPITLGRTPRGDDVTLTADDVRSIRRQAERKNPEDIQVVEAIVRYINTALRSPMQRWHIDRYGWDNTSDEVHFPRERQRRGDAAAPDWQSFGGDLHLTSGSIAKQRTRSTDPIVIKDIFVTFANHAWQVHGIAEMEPAIRNARRVLDSEKVRSLMERSKFGPRLRRYWQNMYSEIVRSAIGGPRLAGPVEDWVSRAVNRTTKGVLAANPFVMLYQVVSVISASVEIAAKHLSAAVLSGATFSNEVDKRARQFSPMIRARFESSMMGLINETAGSGRHMLGFRPRGEALMRGISFFDRLAIRTIWAAAERWVATDIQAGRINLDRSAPEFGEEVARRAERVIARTQPMFDPLHNSGLGISARRNPLVKAVTMFFSQRNQNINMLMRAYMRAKRADTAGQRATQLKNMGVVLVAAPIALTAIKVLRESLFGLWDDDDETAVQNILATFHDSVVGSLYFGDLASSLIKPVLLPKAMTFDVELSPTLGILNDGIRGGVMIGRSLLHDGYDRDGSKVWRGMTNVALSAGAFSGFQITPLLRMGRRWAFDADPEAVGPRRQGDSGRRPSSRRGTLRRQPRGLTER